MIDIASERARAQIYGALALIYAKELSAEAIDAFRSKDVSDAFMGAGFDICAALNGRPRDELALELGVEYARLFLGPGRHIPPYESVHRLDTEGGGLLWGKATAEIKRFVEKLNLSYDKSCKDLPDHISVEFELMEKLIEYETTSFEASNGDGVLKALELQGVLLKDHMIKWIPQFCDKVAGEACLPFYKAAVFFTKDFLNAEVAHERL